MASSSSTAASLSKISYDVFINHRGPDVKKSLASHLYRYLELRGLTAFLDQQELQVGDNFTYEIEAAIRTASVHVAIFSRRYAESSWCLNELLLMLESGAPIIPVFYHVDPADLRWTLRKDGATQSKKRKYSQALSDLEMKTTYDCQTREEKPRYDSTTIQNWRNALSRVADISGLDLKEFNGDEGKLLDKVVEQVLKLVKKPLYVAKFPTGLDEQVNDFEATILSQKLSGIVGIAGLGGVGKTTLASELFNRKKSTYGRSCFLSNVRENIAEKSVHYLQNQLLQDLFKLDLHINNSHEGTEMLRKYLPSSQILLVLDDVDHLDQVDALLPNREESLRFDSLILITSRDMDVLERSGLEKSSIYNLTGLNPEYSRELFCQHAFRRPEPPPEFQYMVDMFLTACQGSPLFLKVFGALLYQKYDRSYWLDQLYSIGRILPDEIKGRLKISFDALNKEEQDIFLDIACFFKGVAKDNVIRIMNASGCQGSLGIQNLQNKCLVDVDSENVIQMHDHIRDLGKHIVAEASGEYSFGYRRWTENIESSVIKELRGLQMYQSDDQDACTEVLWFRGVLGVRFTQDGLLEHILKTVQHSRTLKWLSWVRCPYSSLPSWIPAKNFRLLYVSGTKLQTLWPGDLQAPNSELRELHIDAPLSNIPKSIGKFEHIETIFVGCTVSPVPMLKLPDEFCHLRSLKILLLLRFTQMESLPESFGDLTNLEQIHLHSFESLERLPNSFGNLVRLQILDLFCCHNLTMSTETLGNIRELRYLRISNCSKIEVLPPQIADQSFLVTLDLSGTNLKALPSSTGELSNLKYLLIKCCKDLAEIGTLPNALIELDLFGCSKLASIPGLAQLTKLQKLDVSACIEMEELLGIEHLTWLEKLDAFGCPKLQWGAGVVEKLLQQLEEGMLVI